MTFFKTGVAKKPVIFFGPRRKGLIAGCLLVRIVALDSARLVIVRLVNHVSSLVPRR